MIVVSVNNLATTRRAIYVSAKANDPGTAVRLHRITPFWTISHAFLSCRCATSYARRNILYCLHVLVGC